jgi:CHAD domain-containing protein
MASRVKRRESGVAGVRRILRRETKRALQAMDSARVPRGEAIHDARKRLKKARAALRLARAALPNNEYRCENDTLRDAARPLGEVRDAQVLIDVLDDLAQQSTRAQRRTFGIMRARLKGDRRTLRRRQFHEENVTGAVRRAVRNVRNRSRHWPAHGGWSVLRRGLERVYRAGRESYRAVRRESSNENLHECRKQAKYLWHQLQFLEAVQPRRLKRLERRAHALSSHLGDDHDLAVLRDKLEAARPALPIGALERIEPMIESRRGELQRDALALARQLYGPLPSRFMARVRDDWHAWRSGRHDAHS